MRALNPAADRLAAAEAEANKAEQDVQQKVIEEESAQLDVRTAGAEAAAGSQAEPARGRRQNGDGGSRRG